MPDQPTPYAPCPTCGQYSHSIGDDQLAAALLHLTAMVDHRGDGIPTQYRFDKATRDAVMVLMAQPLRIAAYLDSQAAQCNLSLKNIPEDSVLWTQRRIAARTYRMAADGVRAGFWKGDGE